MNSDSQLSAKPPFGSFKSTAQLPPSPSSHPSVLSINDLQPNPLQPRGKIKKEDLEELISSIKTYGVLEPLVVAHTPAGYQIIAGERRWRAAQLAGLTQLPVIVKETSPKGMLEMAIIENVQRVDLSPVERAQAFMQLVRDFGFTFEQVAERIGKSNAYVSNTINLLRLPDAVKDGLLGEEITEGHARALLAIQDEKTMVECYKQVLKQNASVRQTEELARRYKQLIGQKPSNKDRSRQVIISDEVDRWQQSLQRVFTKDSEVKLVRSTRLTKVMITLHGNPEKTQADLDKILKIAG